MTPERISQRLHHGDRPFGVRGFSFRFLRLVALSLAGIVLLSCEELFGPRPEPEPDPVEPHYELGLTVNKVYDKAEYVDVDQIDILHRQVAVPANLPAPEDLPRAHEYKALHEADRDADIPYTAMELTTVVAEAIRMCNLEHGPAEFHLELTGVRIGDIALIGLPGEPFTDIGRGLKQAPGWKLVLPCCITNGYEGYFPMKEAYDEGGYEARSSVYRAGVAERLIEEGVALLDIMRGIRQ